MGRGVNTGALSPVGGIGAAERMDREFGGSPYGWLMDRQYVKVYNYLTRYGREEDKNVPKKRRVY